MRSSSAEKISAPTTTDPMTVVREFVETFNRGDVKGMAAHCTVPMSILDGLPPHVWHGSNAIEHWHRDVMAAGQKEGASGYFVTLGDPWHVNVNGNQAYVVLSATMTFTVHGKQVTQSGSVFTLALSRTAQEWQIAAWAWAKGTQ